MNRVELKSTIRFSKQMFRCSAWQGVLYVLCLALLASCSTGKDPLQKQFEDERKHFYKEYQNAKNDIGRSDAFNASRKGCCTFAEKHGYTFKKWKAKLKSLTTLQGGSMILQVVLSSKVGSMEIDYVQGTLDKTDVLYEKLSKFKEGDDLYFDFEFNKEIEFFNVPECFNELSITEEGSLRNPEYGIRLIDVNKKKIKI